MSLHKNIFSLFSSKEALYHEKYYQCSNCHKIIEGYKAFPILDPMNHNKGFLFHLTQDDIGSEYLFHGCGPLKDV